MNSKLLGAALALVICACAVFYWSRNSEQREGSGQSSDFVKKWEIDLGAPISAALALADDGTLYAANEHGVLSAISPSGSIQWTFTSTWPIVAAPVIGADGAIYISDKNQMIHVVNHSGTERWAAGGGPYANWPSPWRAGAIDDNYFYTPWRGVMRAFRLTAGQSGVVSIGMGFSKEGTAAITPTGLLVYPGAGRVDAADSSGRTIWQYPPMVPPLTTDQLLKNGGRGPVGNFFLDSGIAMGRTALYAGTHTSTLVAISFSGTLHWEFKVPGPVTIRATPVIAGDGTIYLGCGNGNLLAVDTSGSQKWAMHAGNAVSTTPVLAQDGTIYVLAEDRVAAISPEGKLLSKVELPGGAAAATLAPDGTLYVPLRTGKVIAFATSHGPLLASSPWPKFQHDAANTGRAVPI